MAKKGGGHHGGAWKVAYADFVTAMMALFLVLWLTSQDEKIKEAVERSFKNPFASLTKESTGLIANKEKSAVRSDKGNFDSASAVELNMLRKLSQDLLKTLQNDNPEENDVKVDLTPEGMRITVFDLARRPIFQSGSAEFTKYGQWVFSSLAWQVSRYTNTFLLELEGHTESGQTPPREDYGNWEVSADRANSARRLLLQHGVNPAQIKKVAGFADTIPLPEHDVSDERNRRVAVLLRVNNHLN